MTSAPTLPYDVDPARVQVVDVDGDGCADVVLLRDGALTWWPNRSGDGFGAPRRVAHLPTGAMDDVRVADVLGTGTPALVWSSPLPSGRARWFALDLVGGTRPGLLTTIDNSVGRVTTIEYTTSARGERPRPGTGRLRGRAGCRSCCPSSPRMQRGRVDDRHDDRRQTSATTTAGTTPCCGRSAASVGSRRSSTATSAWPPS